MRKSYIRLIMTKHLITITNRASCKTFFQPQMTKTKLRAERLSNGIFQEKIIDL